MEDNQNGIGTGALVLSFITGIAAGIAAAVLINKSLENESAATEGQEDQLFI